MTLSEKWLERNYKQDDFFLHIDTFDPHEPWDPPQFYVDKYADPDYDGIPMIYPNYGPADIFTKGEIANMEAHYAAQGGDDLQMDRPAFAQGQGCRHLR